MQRMAPGKVGKQREESVDFASVLVAKAHLCTRDADTLGVAVAGTAEAVVRGREEREKDWAVEVERQLFDEVFAGLAERAWALAVAVRF